MKRIALLLAVMCVAAILRHDLTAAEGQDLVNRAVQAVGGAEALARVKTLSVKGTSASGSPAIDGRGGEMRFACASDGSPSSPTSRAARPGRLGAQLPSTRRRATFTFSEIVTPDAGYVAGIDSNDARSRAYDSNPPAHSMSGPRLATSQRELRRGSSLLLLEMQKNPDRVSAGADVTVEAATYPAVNYRVGDQTFTVMFRRVTGFRPCPHPGLRQTSGAT